MHMHMACNLGPRRASARARVQEGHLSVDTKTLRILRRARGRMKRGGGRGGGAANAAAARDTPVGTRAGVGGGAHARLSEC